VDPNKKQKGSDKMKGRSKFIIILTLTLVLLAFGSFAHAQEGYGYTPVKVYFFGQLANFHDAPALIDNQSNRVLVPVRYVSEMLGAEVIWDSQKWAVEIRQNGKVIILNPGSKIVEVNDQAQEIDTSACIIGDRVYVPLRFISEILGTGVYWDGNVHIVNIPWIIQDGVARGLRLFIDTNANKLWEFNEYGKLLMVFPVATGRISSTGILTPKGEFIIANKIVNPPYYRAGIPGGSPRNPLGPRWMGLAGIAFKGSYGIHGTNVPSSIGTHASAGCIRMYSNNAITLYSRTPVGTRGMTF